MENKRQTTAEEAPKKARAVPESLRRMRERVMKAMEGGGAERVEAQKAKGKFTARERIHYLLDEGSFQELDLLMTTQCRDFGLLEKHVPGDGVITGFGRVNGREVCI